MLEKNLSFLVAVTAIRLMENAEECRREKRSFRNSTLHQKNSIYIITQRTSLPEDLTVIQSVWVGIMYV